MEAASLPQEPPAVKAPIHKQHTGQHGDDGLAELIPWSWPGGSHGATTPLPGWSWGSEPGSGRSAYCTGRGAIQGCTPGLHRGPAIMGSDPTRGRQCGHTGSTGRPGKNGETPLAHTHTHTNTQPSCVQELWCVGGNCTYGDQGPLSGPPAGQNTGLMVCSGSRT